MVAAWPFFIVAASKGSFLVAVLGLLISLTSLVEQGSRVCGLRRCGYQALEHQLNSVAHTQA